MAANASRPAPGWRQMEKDLSQRLAAKQGSSAKDRPSAPPDSGVRASQQIVITPPPLPVRSLTYSMYTVSEHDVQKETSRRSLPIVVPPPPAVTWTDARRALHDRAVLVALIRSLPWRRIGFGAAMTGGAFLVFLFAVVTVAELTDDLKPGRKSSTSRTSPPILAPSLPVVAAVVASAPAAVEVDEAPPPPVKKPTAKVKPKSKAKKAPVERFLP